MTLNLDAMRKIAESPGVRPGPWHVYDRGIGYEVHDENDYELTGGMRETFDKADAEFIATFAPPTVLALLSRLEQAEQAVARVREVIHRYDPNCLTCMCNSDGDCYKCTVADFQGALDGEPNE